MNINFNALEFLSIIERLKGHALSERARNTLDHLVPYLSEDICLRKMSETTAARQLLDSLGSPPLPIMQGLDEILILTETENLLTPEQLMETATFASSCKRMTSYLSRGESISETIAVYGCSIQDLSGLREEIEHCIKNNQVLDDASSNLKHIRRKIDHVDTQIKEKLSQILQSRKQYLSDNYITNRQGHYVLPVQRKYQSQFGGTVIEVSGKGSTVFMEPSSISKLQAELTALIIDEDAEVRSILYMLTAVVADYMPAIQRNMEAMEILDVLFAKAKLSASMNARPVAIGGKRCLTICQGRHPLLDSNNCVPLDFQMEEGLAGVIITGPNTGGKTVAVKTVGLLSLMAQCGLHIPCDEGTYIAMQDNYWCDIGDSQNISQNLSTFSGHLTNVIHILEYASRDSLVLLDELGSGTDPAEGMGIAVAVLDELRHRGCMFLVTTHYPQVKTYAENTLGIVSARMAFDQMSLRPLYQLEMGKSGESCALQIAKRLGLPPHLLDRAAYEVYGEKIASYDDSAVMNAPKSLLIRSEEKKKNADPADKFSMGDSVLVLPDEVIGIVYRPADKIGDVIVQIKGKKKSIKHNRLRLHVSATELYPDDYDFSIIFDTAEKRRASKQMAKHHDPNLTISLEES